MMPGCLTCSMAACADGYTVLTKVFGIHQTADQAIAATKGHR